MRFWQHLTYFSNNVVSIKEELLVLLKNEIKSSLFIKTLTEMVLTEMKANRDQTEATRESIFQYVKDYYRESPSPEADASSSPSQMKPKK